jgi:hypothetical protein
VIHAFALSFPVAYRLPEVRSGQFEPKQRQAAYRAWRPTAGNEGNGDRRLDVWVSTEVYLALERLARRDGSTKRRMLEQLISQEDSAVLRTLDPDGPEWDQYFGVTHGGRPVVTG